MESALAASDVKFTEALQDYQTGCIKRREINGKVRLRHSAQPSSSLPTAEAQPVLEHVRTQ